MAMGKRRRESQESLFISADRLPKPAGHPFLEILNQLLADAGFDTRIESRGLKYYEAEGLSGRPSIRTSARLDSLLFCNRGDTLIFCASVGQAAEYSVRTGHGGF
jgi:hypothetical protein